MSENDLIERNVKYILNVTDDVENFFPERFKYAQVKVMDFPTSRLLPFFEDCCSFIAEGLKAEETDGKRNSVLVHCMAGASRSSSFVVAYLLWAGLQKSVDGAVKFARSKRSVVSPNPGFRRQLDVWARHVQRKTVPRTTLYEDMPCAAPAAPGRSFFGSYDPPRSLQDMRAAAFVENSMARWSTRGTDDFDFDSGLLTCEQELQAVLTIGFEEALLATGNRHNSASFDATIFAEDWFAALLEAVVQRGLRQDTPLSLSGEQGERSAAGCTSGPNGGDSGMEPSGAGAAGGADGIGGPVYAVGGPEEVDYQRGVEREGGAGEEAANKPPVAAIANASSVRIKREALRVFVQTKLKEPGLSGVWVTQIGPFKLDRILLRWTNVCKVLM